MPRGVTPYPTGLEPDLWRPDPPSPHHRFLLGQVRASMSPESLLVTIGMNPSHATELQSDATVNIVANASTELGYAGWLMLNLYPERSSKPAELGTFDRGLSASNCAAISEVIRAYGVSEVLGAWGNLRHDTLRRAKGEVLATLSDLGTRVFHFGPLTTQGEPRHPNPQGGKYDFTARKHYLASAS